MATVCRRVREDGAGGISGSQLDAIQQVLEGGVKVRRWGMLIRGQNFSHINVHHSRGMRTHYYLAAS